MSPEDIVIIDAVRTPVGRARGSLAQVRADHLGAVVLQGLAQRTGIDPAGVGYVVFGCVTQIGEQSANIARTSILSAGWPQTVPGFTVDHKCGSSELAVHVAAGLLASGTTDIVIAGGAENMSRVPIGSNRALHGEAFGHAVLEHYEMVSQGEAAERIADQWGFTRGNCDDFAMGSHRRAAAADDAGVFADEIVPVDLDQWQEPGAPATGAVLSRDETIRRETSREKLAGLKSVFRPDGCTSAGNASQIADGAAALLLMRAETAQQKGLRPRARIVATVSVGSDPTLMLTGPTAATEAVLKKAGLSMADIGLFEVNEAFAPVTLMWLKDTGADPARVNVNGGAIALGHPLGASGARIMTSLMGEMERRGARYALQTMCCAGGLATATILERLA